MTLKERINQDLVEALKSKDKDKALALRTLNAAIKNAEIAKRSKLGKKAETAENLEKESVLTDEETIGVIAFQVKQGRDSVAEFEKGSRFDLVEKEKKEIEILMRFMPDQMSEDEIRKIAREAVEKTGAEGMKDMGKVMGALTKETKGKADGAAVSRIVKELLTN